MKIFRWNNPYGKYAVVAFVVAFALLYVRECQADVWFQAGYGTENSFNLLEPKNLAIEGAYVYKDDWEVATGYSNMWYLSGTRVVNYRSLFLNLGLGVNETNENLPKWWNFSLGAGFNIKKCRVQFRHFSNAGIEKPNRGENWILWGCKI